MTPELSYDREGAGESGYINSANIILIDGVEMYTSRSEI